MVKFLVAMLADLTIKSTAKTVCCYSHFYFVRFGQISCTLATVNSRQRNEINSNKLDEAIIHEEESSCPSGYSSLNFDGLQKATIG